MEAAFSYNTSGTCRKRLGETSIPCTIQADTAYSGYGRGLGAELFKDKTADIVCGPAQIPQITKLIKKSPEEKKKALSITEKIRQNPLVNKRRRWKPLNQLMAEMRCKYLCRASNICGQFALCFTSTEPYASRLANSLNALSS